MGNRKKIKNNSLRLKKNPSVLQRGIAKIMQPSDPRPPTHDEAVANPDLVGRVPVVGLTPKERASEEPVVKVVPAKHKGVTVGDAHIHEDGMVTIKFHEDAPKWAIDEIKAVAGEIGYDLQAGEHSGPS